MPNPSPVTMSLPFTASSASVARQQLMEWLVEVGASNESIEDSRLVLSELVGNAVRHAAPLDDGTVQVTWRAHETEDAGALDIAVTDGGAPTVPRQGSPALSDESGRGLGIVEALSNRWWFETTRTRSTVHALIRLAAPHQGVAG